MFFVRSGVRDWIVEGFNDKRKTKHQKETRKKKKKKNMTFNRGNNGSARSVSKCDLPFFFNFFFGLREIGAAREKKKWSRVKRRRR